MMYTIKPEYLDLWGSWATEDDVMTESDLETAVRGWDKTLDDVIDQLNVYNYDAAVELMDDDIREAIHAEMAPCSDIEFMREYEKRHLEKYGEEFTY